MINRIIKRIANRARVTFCPTALDQELCRWNQDGGDSNIRFSYPLTSSSVVIDLGGYDGQWASDLFSRYQSAIYVFEAIPEFADKISRRFVSNSKMEIFPCAIGRNSRTGQMSLDDVGSSLFRGKNKGVTVRVEDAAELFNMCKISHCNLLKINIEGGEYEVLPRLLEAGLISKIDNLQIQFHDLRQESLAQMNAIQSELKKTHELSWQYKWVWENWKRKG